MGKPNAPWRPSFRATAILRKIRVLHHVLDPRGTRRRPDTARQTDPTLEQRFPRQRRESRRWPAFVYCDAPQAIQGAIDDPERADLPPQGVANRRQNTGSGIVKARRVGEDATDHVRRGPAVCNSAPLCDSRCDEQGASGQNAQKDLPARERGMHDGAAWRAEPDCDIPHDHGGCGQHCESRGRLSEPYGGADHKWKHQKHERGIAKGHRREVGHARAEQYPKRGLVTLARHEPARARARVNRAGATVSAPSASPSHHSRQSSPNRNHGCIPAACSINVPIVAAIIGVATAATARDQMASLTCGHLDRSGQIA